MYFQNVTRCEVRGAKCEVRRKSWSWVVLLAATVLALPAAERPNIIHILADDLGWADLGCYGQQVIKTPVLDRLAAEGLRLTQHYAGSTVCGPSRATLLTGLHTGHVRIRGNGKLMTAPDPSELLLPTVLNAAGYRTAMIGKSGVYCDDHAYTLPNDSGFQHFFGYLSHVQAHHPFPPFLVRNGKRLDYPGNKQHDGDHDAHALIIDEALDWISASKDAPFYLHLSVTIPHASLYAPEADKAPYRALVQEPAEVRVQKHYRTEKEPKATFAGMVSRLDRDVGRVVQKLKDLGIDRRTLVVFTSDNGACDEGGHKEADFKSSGPLRGVKRDLYEGGIRSPFIAWWPGTIAPGRTSDHISAGWDLFPTFIELAGGTLPDKIDGISLVPTLRGQGEQRRHSHLYWEFYEQGGKRAVRIGDVKAIQLGLDKSLDGPIEVYDLSTDLGETTDIASARPDIVAKAKELFASSHTPSALWKWKSQK
jgi:arylsulfatase A-like enzyme